MKDGERFKGAATRHANSFKSYMHSYGFTSYSDPELGVEIAHKFVEHMKSKGYKGIVYHNTGPMETFGSRSRKSYIIFEPEKHPLEKIPIESNWRKSR